jgi:hypothetical protein
MEATLSRDDYRTFNEKVQVLESKGYDLPHMVEHVRKSDTFKVKIYGIHDIDVLDGLTNE